MAVLWPFAQRDGRSCGFVMGEDNQMNSLDTMDHASEAHSLWQRLGCLPDDILGGRSHYFTARPGKFIYYHLTFSTLGTSTDYLPLSPFPECPKHAGLALWHDASTDHVAVNLPLEAGTYQAICPLRPHPGMAQHDPQDTRAVRCRDTGSGSEPVHDGSQRVRPGSARDYRAEGAEEVVPRCEGTGTSYTGRRRRWVGSASIVWAEKQILMFGERRIGTPWFPPVVSNTPGKAHGNLPVGNLPVSNLRDSPRDKIRAKHPVKQPVVNQPFQQQRLPVPTMPGPSPSRQSVAHGDVVHRLVVPPWSIWTRRRAPSSSARACRSAPTRRRCWTGWWTNRMPRALVLRRKTRRRGRGGRRRARKGCSEVRWKRWRQGMKRPGRWERKPDSKSGDGDGEVDDGGK
jgi:hypothetical protein